MDLKKLKNEIKKYIRYLEDEIKLYFNDTTEQKLLISSRLKKEKINKIVNELSKKFNNNFKNKEYVITKIIIARELLKFVEDEKIRDFLLLSLSGAISDVIRRTSNQFEKALEIRINDLYLRLYLFHRLNEVLKIKLGDSKTFVSDTRNMKEIKENSITGIVNSPPYSTALDYIKNDYPQLILLELTESMENLEKNMMGNPRVNYDKKQLLNQIKNKDKDPLFISKLAENHIMKLLNNDRQQAGLRCYKFFVDMIKTFEEMNRVLTPDAKCAIIIGNNHFMLNGGYIEIPNDDIL